MWLGKVGILKDISTAVHTAKVSVRAKKGSFKCE